jgi:hypothetical protein
MELGSGSAVDPKDPAAFSGQFFQANATGTISGSEIGFSFESNSATSKLGYAAFGKERNGSFLAA